MKSINILIILLAIPFLSKTQESWQIGTRINWPKDGSIFFIQANSPMTAINVSIGFNAKENTFEQFTGQSTLWKIHSELRFFPWGNQYFLGSHQSIQCPFDRHKKFKGFYLGFGIKYEQDQIKYFPLPEIESVVQEFRYQITDYGISFGPGYQFNVGRVAFGIGGVLFASHPEWSGPTDIFGNNLYTIVFPLKLKIIYGLNIEVAYQF